MIDGYKKFLGKKIIKDVKKYKDYELTEEMSFGVLITARLKSKRLSKKNNQKN